MNYIDRGFEWESIDHATKAGVESDDVLNEIKRSLHHVAGTSGDGLVKRYCQQVQRLSETSYELFNALLDLNEKLHCVGSSSDSEEYDACIEEFELSVAYLRSQNDHYAVVAREFHEFVDETWKTFSDNYGNDEMADIESRISQFMSLDKDYARCCGDVLHEADMYRERVYGRLGRNEG